MSQINEETNKFEVLSGREQILRRPTMWIGAIDQTEKEMFVVSEDKIEKKNVCFVPAVRKLFDEILDNSLDVLINQRNSKGTIKVEIDTSDNSVYVEDDGPGMPVVKNDVSSLTDKSISEDERRELAESYVPFTAWTRLFSGSNFQDSENKTTIGSHGIGSKACSIFSVKFFGHTDDGKKSCHVVTENNLETKSFKVKKSSGKTGTWVKFWPDLARFGLEKIEPVYIDLMYQRLISLSITFPEIKFFFNGKKISVGEKKFLKMFSDNIETETFKNGFVGVFPNEQDEFSFFSYVNGMFLSRGGSHVDYVCNALVSPIREKLCKKYKSLKPGDIKNRLGIVVFLRNFPNPKFDSQTKETLTNSISEISKYFGDSFDFSGLAKSILKNDAIVSPIVETFKLKEELKSRQEMKQSKRAKVKSDKYMSSTGEKKYLLACEGLSARSGLSAALGRDGFAYYAARGVPLNAYDATIQAISANQELKDIANILELDIFGKEEHKTIAFDKIVFANDADNDGIFIASQYIGWFVRFAPNLFKEHKIARLITPLAVLKDKREMPVKYFYNLADFKDYESKNDLSKYKIEYYKGLGSWEKEEFQKLFSSKSFEYFLQDLELDERGKIYVNDWLSGKEIEKRKQYLREFTLDIETM